MAARKIEGRSVLEVLQNFRCTLRCTLSQLCKDDSGQDLVEYSLLLAFIALAAVGLLSGTRTTVSKLWSTINNTLASASTTVS